MYGQAGPFGAAAMVGQIHGAGGSGGFHGNLDTRDSVGSGVRRTASHQSMSTLSHAASGALDRSAGSTHSQGIEEQARRPPCSDISAMRLSMFVLCLVT